jgi:hypothetical protein
MKRMIGSCLAVLLLVAGPAYAADPPQPGNGRGWMFGLGLGPGRVSFGGAKDLAVVIGGPTRRRTVSYLGTSFEVTTGEVVPRMLIPADAESIVPIPSVESGLAVSLHVGYSYSPRWAALFEMDGAGGYEDSFTNFMGAFVARYSPASRVWIEAGPAFGNLTYNNVDIEGLGAGGLVGAGLEIVKRPKWRIDVELRAGTLWYREFRATNLSAQLAIGRRRS